MNEPLKATLADAVSLLRQADLAYALIGGLAVSLRGQPRVTADVDMIVTADVQRALRLARELDDTSFRPLFEDVAEVIETAFILPLRHRTTNVKLDLALGMSGFEKRAVERAEVMDVSGAKVSVATAEDLLIMKVLAGRPQDDQDVRGLLIARGDCLDWEYCLKLSRDLGDALGDDLATRVALLRTQSELDRGE